MLSFYNKQTKRENNLSRAKKNGLFTNPANFQLPYNVGLDLKNKKAILKKTLAKKLREGKLQADEIYYPGYVVLPSSKKIVKSNKKNKTTAATQETKIKNKRVLDELKTTRKQLTEQDLKIKTETVNFKNVAMRETITTNIEFTDMKLYKTQMKTFIMNRLKDYLNKKGAYKVLFRLDCKFERRVGTDFISKGDVGYEAKYDGGGHGYEEAVFEYIDASFSSGGSYNRIAKGGLVIIDTALPILSIDDIVAKYYAMFDTIEKRIENFIRQGSDWVFSKVNFLVIKYVKYVPFKGASYMKLPDWLKNKKCCINVINNDDRCFEYAVLSALHNKEIKHTERVSSYKPYLNSLNFDNIDFPVESSSYELFERQNNIPINVFSLDISNDDNKSYDVEYIHKIANEKTIINILRVYDDNKSHYLYIKNLNGFIRSYSGHELYCCSKCLQRFSVKHVYENHITKNKCEEFKGEAVKVMPADGKHICEFKNTKKQMRVPFVIYADIESILIPVDKMKGENTHIYQTHKANHVGCKLVSSYPDILCDSYKQFDGEDCVDKFLEYIFKMQYKAIDILKVNQEMVMTDDDIKRYESAVKCNLCNKDLNGDSVRDHDHLTGKYRGACHNACNINYNYKDFKLPIIFHNLRGYDSHLIINSVGKFNKKISCIPNTMEKYMSFTLDRCIFIDSLQFTLSGLDKLVSALNKVQDENVFKTFNSEINFDDEVKQLLRQKGVFPYDWFDGADKLNHTTLPDINAFYSKLDKKDINKVDYERAVNVWDKTGCQTFYDYLALYLKTDVLLLADVFEAFRKMCMNYYGLDPCHYFTAPGFSWDAMLKMTDVKIECFKEGQEDMLDMIQKGMRGGVSMISTRYAKANNKYMKEDYNPAVKSSYITYLDANNLYGWAMSQYLPIGNYNFDNVESFTKEKIMSISETNSTGYIFECDLIIPAELHDKFNDYPLAPETTLFEASPKMQELKAFLDMPDSKVNKLIPNLCDKTKYVLHYRNLQQYLSLGVELKCIHRVLSFTQKPYLKEYIDFNTKKRAESTNDFEKDLFKLFNNAIFGKTCENVAKRINVELISDSKKFVNTVSKPYFKDFKIFSNDLVACEMSKTTITYDRPMIVGMCILDLSKVLMYDFHYNHIGKTYGNKAKLLFTDTDSLTYHIETDDFYKDMKQNLHLYDTSDYPKEHFCYSVDNKKVIGKFKDETNAQPIKEFVGLRAKMYSILKYDDASKAVAKGVKRSEIKNLTHENYKRAVFGSSKDDLRQKVNFNIIGHTNHILYTMNVNKTGLCAYDDKKYVLDDNINTLAHGHYKIKNI